jgi:putative PIN family toxin of toxin-antitoxin system
MRAVVDTNVIVSASLIRNGNENRVLRAWQRGAFDLVLSPQILEEVGRALFYERIRERRWMTDADVVEFLEALAAASVLVPGRRRVRASRDPDDDKFLGAALEAGARFVISGDRDLLALRRFRNVRLVSPATFLRVLRDDDA